jgi:hypothetical protein
LIEALRRLERGISEYESLVTRIKDAASSLAAERSLNANQIGIRKKQLDRITDLNELISENRDSLLVLRQVAQATRTAADFLVS